MVAANVLTVTTDANLLATDWLLMTVASDISDLSGNEIQDAGMRVAIGGSGDNTINASELDLNVILGFAGDDILTGGINDEYFEGGSGADVMVGGGGFDEFSFSESDTASVLAFEGGVFSFNGTPDSINLEENTGGLIFFGPSSESVPPIEYINAAEITDSLGDQQYTYVLGIYDGNANRSHSSRERGNGCAGCL